MTSLFKRAFGKGIPFLKRNALCRYFGNSSSVQKDYLVISDEVAEGIHSKKPIVALESTIITHGMPYPENLSTAKLVENTVRINGAIPATIAIINGKIHVGITNSQLETLASLKLPSIKTSRRDMPYVISQSLNGGTTVSGTMIAAQLAGIPVFVTGGIGGVHRNGENTLDISADLTELGRTPIAVISAGVKSILDIGRTLEYLETQGVCVASYGSSKDFPAFFTPKSGSLAPYNVTSPEHAAKLIDANLNLGLNSGTLISVPIPKKLAGAGSVIEKAIQFAIKEAEAQGISGKEVTPFILKRVNEITEGKSLQANIALIENNAEVGSKIACALSKLRQQRNNQNIYFDVSKKSSGKESHKKPVIIGGTMVDFVVTIEAEDYGPTGATYPGNIQQACGGVGRNIAEAMGRLGSEPYLFSAVGNDKNGDFALDYCKGLMNTDYIFRHDKIKTATYLALLEKTGKLNFGVGDFHLHQEISKDFIKKNKQVLINSSITIMDGNIPEETMDYVIDLCHDNNVPVLFEPTDLNKAMKPFSSSSWKKLVGISPNMKELIIIYNKIIGKDINLEKLIDKNLILDEKLCLLCRLIRPLLDYIPFILVTLGKQGATVGVNPELPQFKNSIFGKSVKNMKENELSTIHYPAYGDGQKPERIVSVSGAGDCMIGAILSGVCKGYELDLCIKSGLLAAQHSLQSHLTVPPSISADKFTIEKVNSWSKVTSTVIS